MLQRELDVYPNSSKAEFIFVACACNEFFVFGFAITMANSMQQIRYNKAKFVKAFIFRKGHHREGVGVREKETLSYSISIFIEMNTN